MSITTYGTTYGIICITNVIMRWPDKSYLVSKTNFDNFSQIVCGRGAKLKNTGGFSNQLHIRSVVKVINL